MRSIWVCMALVSVLSACGKSVEVGTLPARNAQECGEPARWSFTQPVAQPGGAVDLLFVVDTSGSLIPERDRLADTIPSFVSQLSPEVDFRIATMLGHGGKSPWSGKLFSARGEPRVLSSGAHSIERMRASLRKTLRSPALDSDVAGGEALFYSLLRGMGEEALSASRAQGFFRPEAALSVIFVSDENELCYPPESFGYTSFPDFVPSPGGYEAAAFRRYCGGISPESVARSLRAFQPERAISAATIVHSDPARVPAAGEDSLGHGYLELLDHLRESAVESLALGLSEPSYSEGLARLGNVVSSQLKLQTVFQLTGARGMDPASLTVLVDGRNVPAQLDPEAETIRLLVQDAGREGSVIEVSASRCQAR